MIELMNIYSGLIKDAARDGDYQDSINYSIAEDLTDSILKQMTPGAPHRLITAFESNLKESSSDEAITWEIILMVAQQFFDSKGISYTA